MALPLPQPVGPGGGILASLGAQNAVTKSALENKISSAQAKYAPYQAYGNAFLTNQQAQWLPYQYQMQALSNPLLWMAAQNNPALMNQLKTMMQNPMQGTGAGGQQGGLNIPLPNAGGSSNSLFSMLMNALTGNKEGNALANTPSSPGTNALLPPSQTAGSTGTSPDSGAINQATPQQVMDEANRAQQAVMGTPSIAAQTPAQQQASKIASGGGLGAENPMSASNAQQKGMEQAVTGSANTQTELQNIRTKQLTAQSQLAIDAKKALDSFHRNYVKSLYKGQYITPERAESLPKLPGSDNSAEQLTNRYGNQLVNYLSGLGNTPAGKTDAGRELIASGKMDISLSSGAEKELYDSFNSQLTRMETLRDFGTDFYKKNPGATDEELVGLMNSYNRHAPAFDAKTGKAHPENEKKYKDFTSPQALAEYRANGDYNPYKNKENKPVKSQKSAKNTGKGFNPVKMLDYKYGSKEEFLEALNSLGDKAKQQVIDEMNRRGWH